MSKNWDGNAFRSRMLSAAKAAQRYSDEHSDRIRRNHPTGRASIRDEYLGEADVCDVLCTSAAADTPSSLLAHLDKLEKLLEDDTHMRGVSDKEAFRRGFKAKIREIRAEVQAYAV